jgi:hypothetical protein
MAAFGNGPGGDRDHASRPTNATKTPISSAPSVPLAEQARRWPYLMPTHSPCSFTWTRYPAMSPRARTQPELRFFFVKIIQLSRNAYHARVLHAGFSGNGASASGRSATGRKQCRTSPRSSHRAPSFCQVAGPLQTGTGRHRSGRVCFSPTRCR